MNAEQARNFLRNIKGPDGSHADRIWTSHGREILIVDLTDEEAIHFATELEMAALQKSGVAYGRPGNWKIKKEFID